MATVLITKTTKPKSKRIQIAFTSSPAFQSRIDSLSNKYYGMSISEIFKMAIIKLDNTEDEDETDFIRKDKVLYETLLKHKNDGLILNSKTDKIFKNINEFNDAASQF
jgi:hypothetical protein